MGQKGKAPNGKPLTVQTVFGCMVVKARNESLFLLYEREIYIVRVLMNFGESM